MLHSGGKFSDKAYATSGGLHGVGVSVVNALSSDTMVEVARNKQLYRQTFSRGAADLAARNDRPDPESPRHDHRLHARHRDFRDGRLVQAGPALPARPLQGLSVRRGRDTLALRSRADLATTHAGRGGVPIPRRPRRSSERAGRRQGDRDRVFFTGKQDFPNGQGSVEWAVAWPLWGDGAASYYCNTIPTPDGGTHEQGLRAALTRGLRAFAELVGQKKAKDIQAEDVTGGRRDHALGLHPRSPVPEPDQGPADLARRRAAGRECGARPFRPLSSPTIWSAAAPCSASCSTGWTNG